MIDQDLLLTNFKNFLTLQGSSLRTQKGYVFDLQDFLQWLNDKEIMLNLVSKIDVETYINSLKNEGKSIATMNRVLSSLRVFFDFLLQQKLVQDNPMQYISNIDKNAALKEYIPLMTAYEMQLKHHGLPTSLAAHQKTVVSDFLRWVSQKTPA